MNTDEDPAKTVPPLTTSASAEPAPPVPSADQPANTDDAATPSVAETLQQMQAAPAAVTEQPAVAVSEQPAVAPTTPPESAPEASAVPAVPEAAVAAESTAPVTDDSSSTGGERPSERVRHKLGGAGGDRPVGSVDISTQRPEIPTNVKPVDIPESDDLDEDIAGQIAAAMQTDVAVPVTAVPIPAEEMRDVPEVTGAVPHVELEEVGVGSRVKGTIQHIHGDDVFLNAGLRSDIMISLKQFAADKQPSVGDPLEVVIDNVDADGLFKARLPEAKTKTGGNWDGLAAGQVVDCTVTAINKGGLQVLVGGLSGFLPASQVDVGYVSELEKYVGQKLSVQITEVKPKKRNLVVSRRAILQAEREEAQAGFWETLEVGQDYPGTVKTLKNYGAFVSLGPIDGFLHVGEISWSRINHPNEVLKEGQEVQVRILKIDKEKSRISLGMKQMMQNPWQGLSDRYPTERVVSGKVTRVSDFGAFVELEPGVEGLVHISQLSWKRVNTVGEAVKVGDEKEFQVLEVDQKRKRVSLSLKALEQKPESVRKAEAEEETRPVRKPNPNLRGGAGGKAGGGGGGLFGNPSDFNT